MDQKQRGTGWEREAEEWQGFPLSAPSLQITYSEDLRWRAIDLYAVNYLLFIFE